MVACFIVSFGLPIRNVIYACLALSDAASIRQSMQQEHLTQGQVCRLKRSARSAQQPRKMTGGCKLRWHSDATWADGQCAIDLAVILIASCTRKTQRLSHVRGWTGDAVDRIEFCMRGGHPDFEVALFQ
eukprot:6459706-Amphidinium_carterae.1